VASLKQFKLPDVGEGLTEGEVARWLLPRGGGVVFPRSWRLRGSRLPDPPFFPHTHPAQAFDLKDALPG